LECPVATNAINIFSVQPENARGAVPRYRYELHDDFWWAYFQPPKLQAVIVSRLRNPVSDFGVVATSSARTCYVY
jgi:hypothetical protein